MSLQDTFYLIVILIAIVIILIYGQGILIPFILGLLLWFIARKVKSSLDRVGFIKSYFPSWAKSILSFLLIVGVLGIASNILSNNINYLAASYQTYETNLTSVLHQLDGLFNMDVVEYIKIHSGDVDFGALLGSVLNSLSYILSNAFMIILYSIFILSEEAFFGSKLHKLFASPAQYEAFSDVMTKIENSVSSYLGLKTLVSFITGILSFLVLWFVGIDAPIFWAFLIFLLNFIPTVGSLVATTFPTIFCLLQFGEIQQALIVLILVGGIQLIVGNFLEPMLMGRSMNISSLVTILALSFWGAIWGVTGMILSIPIMVILLIICSQFEATRPIAILLSENGDID